MVCFSDDVLPQASFGIQCQTAIIQQRCPSVMQPDLIPGVGVRGKAAMRAYPAFLGLTEEHNLYYEDELTTRLQAGTHAFGGDGWSL